MPHVDEGTLHAYLDGELPSAERKTVDAHLAECTSCRAMLVEERALLERASALLGAARPVDRAAPPFEQLGVSRSRKRSPWHVRMPVAWAASIALALGVGYYLHEPNAASLTPRESSGIAYLMEQRAADANRDLPAPADEERKTSSRAPSLAARSKPAAVPTTPQLYDSVTVVASQTNKREAVLEAAPVVGVVAIPPAAAPRLRNAEPAPAASAVAKDSAVRVDGVIVASGASGAGGRKERAHLPTTTSWPIITRGAARSLLGTEPVGLPGLARQIRRSPTADGTVVVEQRIDSATTIQIFQRQSGMDSSGQARYYYRQQEREIAPADRLARYVGRLRVEIAGPLSTDSLNKLLDQVQPLP